MSRKSPFNRLSMRIAGERSSALDQARGRIVMIVAMFLLVYILVAARLVDATLIQGHFKQQEENFKQEEHHVERRADILDRNGVILATSLKTASLYADARHIMDAAATSKALVQIFPDLAYGDTLKKLQSNKRFIWLKRNLSPEQQQKILEIGDPGLAFDYDYRRIYPEGALTSHLVGYTGIDGNGQAGVERSFNKLLKSHDEPLRLTVDVRLQHILKRETKRAIGDFTGIGGAGVILDADTGEVLAAASLPDFDPHEPIKDVNDPKRFNRFAQGVYELGSVFKTFSFAAFIDRKHPPMSEQLDATKPLKRGRFMINDFHGEKRMLTIPEAFMVSSNIGTALLGEQIGTKGLRDFYSDLGLIKKSSLELDEVGAPLIPKPWREINTLTASYGHGIAVTPIQAIGGFASIVNGGFRVNPTLVLDEDHKDKSRIRVISKDTSLRMRQLLRLVVTDGTARKADVKGYFVGGKTGTADKNVGGHYDHNRRVSTFVGAFPIQDPKYIVLIMVDEPKPNKSSYGYATAGWVSAPAVAKVVSSAGPLLNMKSNPEAPEIEEPLRPYLHKLTSEH